ncbi:unnamed protein product, partial [Ascophyllum nodosum]
PSISCDHGHHPPTLSTAPPLPNKILPATETFHYTSQETDVSDPTNTRVGEPDGKGPPTNTLVGNPTARDPTNTLVDRSKVSDKGFDAESRLFLVRSNFVFFNIKKRRVHLPEDESWGEQNRSRAPEGKAAGT